MADRRLAWALVAVIVRYLTTIQPHARRELARWRRRALAIPDPELRAHVLHPFQADESAIGASIFAVLAPWQQQPALVRLLIAYVLLWSYVDVRTERDPGADPRLYDTLLAALPLDVAFDFGWAPRDDAGYLATLLATCHRACLALPSWKVVALAALCLADDGRTVQQINHGPPDAIGWRLRAWAAQRPDRPWYEVCAGASSPLAIHALMALAAHAATDPRDVRSAVLAYRRVSALGVLCDHLIDQAEDDALTNHSYLRYLGCPAARPLALGSLAKQTTRGLRPLPRAERHTVILAAMTAMFLSREQASDPPMHATSVAILEAVGPPTSPLLAVLRMRRRSERPRCAAAR